ncbi:MAG TPA: lipid IV(A) 3-deoxy-D-manno-octulosonic acid transferase [Burkholderiaceae bacterium]|nr:lipid IV(A) 3-deoxy-D-manno-octulosonic acid transferase [Burkholderiaceae bacterium]
MSRARFFYTLFVVLALPLAAVYLLWRSRRQPAYREHWSERYTGAVGARPPGPLIWLHAVSLGETRAAQPLVEALAQAYPRHHILLTHMTPTGREAGAALSARLPGRIVQRYLPYDLPWTMRRFLREARPDVGLIMETEVWPNLIAQARVEDLPLVLVNARLSEKSAAKAQRTPALMREAAQGFTRVLAQTAADAGRLRAAGAQAVEVVGNLKFDLTPNAAQMAQGRAWRAAIQRPVLMFASSREGEETLLLAARAAAPSPALLVIVPRHPQRFDEVAALVAGTGARTLRRSQLPAHADAAAVAAALADVDVLLGDSMGEMALYYALADAALIGGSLQALGGQNLIEACAVGTPALVGPSTYNFAQATEDAIAAGAVRRVPDAAAAWDGLLTIATDPDLRARMSAAGEGFAAAHRGATARTLEWIAPLLTEAGR